MTAAVYTCPACQVTLRSAKPLPAGQRVKCRHCGKVVLPVAKAAAPAAVKRTADDDDEEGGGVYQLGDEPATAAPAEDVTTRFFGAKVQRNDRDKAAEIVGGPAQMLMMTGLLTILVNLGATGYWVFMLVSATGSEGKESVLLPVGGIALHLVGVVVGAVITHGAISMQYLERYGAARLAAILALTPFTAVVGMLSGFVSLAALGKPIVRKSFGRGGGGRGGAAGKADPGSRWRSFAVQAAVGLVVIGVGVGLAYKFGYKAFTDSKRERAQMSEGTAGLAKASAIKNPSKLTEKALVMLGQQVTAVAFSGDGTKILTGRENGETILWDVAESGTQLRHFTPHAGKVTTLAAAVEGTRFVTGGEDKLVRVWDYEGGNTVREYTAHTRPITCVAMSRDGKQVASASDDGFVRVWNADGGADLRTEDFKTTVNTLAFTPAGKLVIGDGNGKISVWGTPIEGKTTEEHTIDLGAIISLVVSPDGEYVLFGDASGYARVLHLTDGELSKTGPRHANADLTAVAYAGGVRRAVTAATDKTIRLWNMDDATELARVSLGEQGAVKKLMIAPNANRLLFCTEDGTVFIDSLAE